MSQVGQQSWGVPPNGDGFGGFGPGHHGAGGQSGGNGLEQALSDEATVFEAFATVEAGGDSETPPIQIPLSVFNSIWDFLSGGGNSSPPIPYQMRHHRHPIYSYLGIAQDLTPTQASEAKPPSDQKSELDQEVSAIENIPVGAQEGLLESKEGAGLVAEGAVDLAVDESAGNFVAGVAAGVAADLLVRRYYQPLNPLAVSALRVAGFGGALLGGARPSDYRRVYRFLLP